MDNIKRDTYINPEEDRLQESKDELDKLETRVKDLEETNEELSLQASILDKATDAIFLRDMNRIIIFANDTACKTYGYSKEEFTGMNVNTLIPGGEMPDFEERLKTIMDNGELTAEVTHLRKDKSLIPVEVHTHRILIGKREYILSVTRDITRRKIVREALGASEEKYRLLVENANEGIFVAQDLLLKFFNNKTVEITGYSPEELSSKPFVEFIYPEDRDLIIERHQKRIRGENIPSCYEFRILRKDAAVRWVELHAVLINWQCRPATLNLVTDITERKAAEEKIRQNEQQFEKLFNAMTEGVALISPDGQVLKVNRAEREIVGAKESENIEQYFKNPGVKHLRTDGTELPLEEMVVSLAIKRKRTIRNMEVGNIGAGGAIRWFNVNAAPILDQQGKVISVVRTITDITEKKQLQTENEKFTRRLIEVQEEERKRIARELNEDAAQNLALLMLEIDNLLQIKENLPEKYLSRLEKLREDLSRTQNDIRRYAHDLRPGVLDYLGLEAALEGLVEDLNHRDGIKTNLKITGHKKPLSEDVEIVLFRIAQEAANNIRKHGEATQATISLKWTPEKVRLGVSDNGKGFKLFEVKKPGVRRGMGLMDMNERAQLIGAKLNLKSNIGKGTTVSVRIISRLLKTWH